MKNIDKDVLAIYGKKVDARVETFMQNIAKDIDTQKKPYTQYTRMILTLMVSQLVLYYKALDEMEANNVESQDSYKRKSKAPSIAIMQKANDQILHLMDKIGLSPLESAKIRKLNKSTDDESAEELLAELTK